MKRIDFGVFSFKNRGVVEFDEYGYDLIESLDDDVGTPVFLRDDFGFDIQTGFELSSNSDLAIYTKNEEIFFNRQYADGKEFCEYFEKYKFMVQFNCLGMTDLFFFENAYDMSIFFAGIPKDIFFNLEKH